MTDLAALEEWMHRYVEAWRSNDPETIGALFTDDATHRYDPFQEPPITGRQAIVESWLETPDEPGTWEMRYEALAVNGDLGVVRCWTTYAAAQSDGGRGYSNIFVVRLDTDGRCGDFTEWYMKRPDDASQQPPGPEEAPAL